ncbi:MAG TPA: bifunctional aspartate kinase/homoserine dehydrogenase I, partial [Chitinophagaceae bacterium]|nr:bifunctional aspartate kinase/homoserine dehydrogenase I [Chitinophagaceae bacterium]
MQVLKFGGTSVANAGNINKVIEIVRGKKDQLAGDRSLIVVVSALGGVTDLLLQAASLASAGDETYRDKLTFTEQRHLEAVKQLIPVANQSQLLSLVKKCCHEIEDICSGIFLLGELTARTKDRVASYGEWLSSRIISAAMESQQISNTWKDSRELIITNAAFTH